MTEMPVLVLPTPDDQLVEPSTDPHAGHIPPEVFERLRSQYGAIGRATAAAQIDAVDDDSAIVQLPPQDGFRFEFLRLMDDGSLELAYEAPSIAARCPALVGEDAQARSAVESRRLIVDEAREETPATAAACAACSARPRDFTLVMPVLWHDEPLGVCRVVRCSPSQASLAVETRFVSRLAESLAATEKFRQMRILRTHEMREVARKERELLRSQRWLRLGNSVACDIVYQVEVDSGRVTEEVVGGGLPLAPRPDGVEPVAWFRSLIHPDDVATWEGSFATVFREPAAVHSVEYRLLCADGLWRNIRESHIVDPGSHGEPTVHVGAIKDVTNEVEARGRLNAERALLAHLVEERTAELSEANADLARAARLKDEFLASMSHELRTPLNAILGMTEAVREGVWGVLSAAQDEKLLLVDESGRHLLSLINDILDLAKIGAGKFTPEFAPVDAGGTATATMRFVSQLALERRVQLECRVPPEGAVIETDGRMLMQILLNLLNNAVKFTPEGGRVVITVEPGPDIVTFRVTDTGIGIAAAEVQRIFRPFVQVNQGLARPYGGTGLGLALVAGLVDKLHGGIEVTSELGRGSEFIVRLPIRPDGDLLPDERAGAAGSSKRSLPRRSVLLAEDDEPTARTYLGYLTAKGYSVTLAGDGEEVLRLVPELQPSLILMDIQMPRLDGLETIRRLRADPAFRTTPIIALTALAMPGDRARCLEAGANDYVTKPTSLRDLRQRIAGFIGAPDDGLIS